MLECPAAQAEIALHRVTADGLAEQRDETWNLTQAGADHLREALPGPPVPRHGFAARRTHLRLRIQNAGNGLRDLHEAYARPAAQSRHGRKCGYLELLLNQLAQWQNRRLTAPEARSFVHYAFAAHDASLYYMEERGPLLRLHEKGRRIRRLRRG